MCQPFGLRVRIDVEILICKNDRRNRAATKDFQLQKRFRRFGSRHGYRVFAINHIRDPPQISAQGRPDHSRRQVVQR